MKKIIIILSLFLLTTSCSTLNIFGFGEKKDKFTKLGINKYLWVASNNLLNKYEDTTNNLGAAGGDYIYMAFAESPFVNSNGVPSNAG